MTDLKTVAEVCVVISSIFSTSVVGVILFQHNLMWKDFKKRHRINGSGSADTHREG